jgi:hypothetical protein
MPTTYAHYTFGSEVLKELKGDLKQTISENRALYNIGLHGPDILFYYKPLKSNFVNRKGNEIHEEKSDVFFEKAGNLINACSDKCDKQKAISYIAGFICHFMLDSECHPYIREKESDNLSHNEIESEFDRIIMINNDLNPISFKPTSHIVIQKEYADCISLFYDDIDSEVILKTLKSMRFYLNFLVTPSRLKRFIIFNGLNITGNSEKMKGLIMNYDANPSCIEINENLHNLYMKAIIPTVDLIYNFYENISDNNPLNIRFHRNFG